MWAPCRPNHRDVGSGHNRTARVAALGEAAVGAEERLVGHGGSPVGGQPYVCPSLFLGVGGVHGREEDGMVAATAALEWLRRELCKVGQYVMLCLLIRASYICYA